MGSWNPLACLLCLLALRCAALVAVEKTKDQTKKVRLTRQKGARRVPRAMDGGSGDGEVVLPSHTEVVADGVGDLLASACVPEHLRYFFSWKIKAAEYHPALASSSLGMAARLAAP